MLFNEDRYLFGYFYLVVFVLYIILYKILFISWFVFKDVSMIILKLVINLWWKYCVM